MKTTFSNVIASTLLATGLAISFVAAPAQAKNDDNSNKTNNSTTETKKDTSAPAQANGSNNQKETEKPDNSSNGGGQGNNQTSSTDTATPAVECNTNNVFLGGIESTACKNETGNDTGEKGTLEGLLKGGLFSSYVGTNVNWTLVGKSDGGEGGDFGFFADNGKDQGTWGFDTKLNTNTFVVSLKSSTAYTAYLFQNYDWSKGLTGIFNTIGVELNGSGNAGKDLSHASIFASNITTVTPPPVQSVPEPATLVGLGLVFGGMLSVRRRKSH